MNISFLYLNSDEESQAVRVRNRQKIVVVMNRNLNEDQEIIQLNWTELNWNVEYIVDLFIQLNLFDLTGGPA